MLESAARTLLDFGRSRLRAQLGVTTVLHTWTRELRFHPHAHCIVTAGARRRRALSPARSRFLFPVKAMSEVFRGKLLEGLGRLYERHALDLGGPCAEIAAPEAFARLKDQLYRKPSVVYAKPLFRRTRPGLPIPWPVHPPGRTLESAPAHLRWTGRLLSHQAWQDHHRRRCRVRPQVPRPAHRLRQDPPLRCDRGCQRHDQASDRAPLSARCRRELSAAGRPAGASVVARPVLRSHRNRPPDLSRLRQPSNRETSPPWQPATTIAGYIMNSPIRCHEPSRASPLRTRLLANPRWCRSSVWAPPRLPRSRPNIRHSMRRPLSRRSG